MRMLEGYDEFGARWNGPWSVFVEELGLVAVVMLLAYLRWHQAQSDDSVKVKHWCRHAVAVIEMDSGFRLPRHRYVERL